MKVMITGATSGIGFATAIRFAQEGHSLILTGRRETRLRDIANDIEINYHAPVKIYPLDVMNRDAIRIMSKELEKDLTDLDVLVNNAGLALGKSSFEEGLESDWEVMLDTNVKGLIYVTKEIVPIFIANRGGHIINISSTAARDMYVGGNVYSASKCAVDGFTKSLRLDLLQYGIKVSSIAPGMVETEFSEVRFHGDKEKAASVYKGFTPLKAEDVADSIYYIASRPPHVHIGDIFITCTAQANSNIVYKA